MRISVKTGVGETVLGVEGDLTIFEAAEFQRAMADIPISEEQFVVDLGATDSLDGAGVQVLLSLKRKVEALGFALVIREASAPAAEALRLVGLVEHFRLSGGETRHD